ncbi:hypothetical protein C475_21949 [Halosimplex carlsbadense 2-9-1]|uniref:DUF7282 domain-containing protein n=1 Tax=Halosimplex carlsbadense 2-9-1 TaxID=797114 RepID=M0C9R9_9EURY|nr:hypothetical protein C475_21949 [Halosimplex carlsbadense 2-9-1]
MVVLSMVPAAAATAGAVSDATTAQGSASVSEHVEVDNESAKSLTLSWYRDDGDGNGPYPFPPNEYSGDSPGLEMITNAEGDAHMRVDNSTARNPGGNWDMAVVHVETSGVEELDPDDNGVVTENFLASENWSVDVSQVGGDKELNVSANQRGFEPAPVEENTSADIPPVVVLGDTEEVEGDWSVGDDPDTGVYVWIDPNRATLTENGEAVDFSTGEEYQATFDIHGETVSTNFELVDGTGTLNESYEPGNRFTSEVSGAATLAAGTEMQMELTFENGDTQTETVELEGNYELGGDTEGTIPEGPVTAAFNLSGREDQSFDLTLYAPGTPRDDDEYLTEDNRIPVANSSGTVQDIIDPDYTIGSANLSDGKPLGLPYGIEDYSTPAEIANSIGDGEVGHDDSLAYDPQGAEAWDAMWLHYETSQSVFPAISKSPGRNANQKFVNSPLSLELVQTNADGEPKELDLARNASGVTVVQDPDMADERVYDNESQGVFVYIDPNEAVLYRDGEPVSMEPGETYEGTMTVETEDGDLTETVTFETLEAETWVDNGDPVEVSQTEEAEITLNTQIAAGAEWTIDVTSPDANVSESWSEIVNEGSGPVMAGKIPGSMPNSSVSVTMDTSGLEYGTELVINASRIEDPPDSPVYTLETTAEVVAPPTASISMSDQAGDGQSVVVDSVELSDGGFVSVHTGSQLGPTVGATEFLESGERTDLEIALDEAVSEDATLYVVAHQDTNGNQAFDFPAEDDPYEVEGSVIAASGAYTVESTETATPTATPDPTPTATDEPSSSTPTATDEPAEGMETTSGDGPGFGVGAAVVALLAAALVAASRRD